MKRIILYINILILIFSATSCDDTIKPPVKPEEHYNIISIRSLKDRLDLSVADSVYLDADEYISGVVTANDASGNFYKQINIQDATAGLTVKINSTGLSDLYSPGDSIIISLNGLYLSGYAGVKQLGSYYEDDLGIIKFGGIPSFDIPNYIFNKGFKGEPAPKVVTIRSLTDDMEGMLVKFENVQFRSDQIGMTWADGSYSGNRLLTDCDTTIIVRTSSYASFAQDLLPELNGTLVGIFSYYYTEFTHDRQIYIRNLDDVVFTNERCDDGYVTPIGDGSKDNPYNVVKAQAVNSGEGWVKGYIVGTVDGISWEDDSNLEGDFQSNTNIIIADSPDETRLEYCMPVQLPAGEIRDALNLVDNPDNQKKEVMVYGILTSYYGVPGVKETSGYWLDGTGVNPAFFFEGFNSDIGSFTAFNVTGAEEWSWSSYDNGCMKGSGYNSGAHANEDWLISPAIDLSSITSAILTFRHAWNYKTTESDITLWISTDFDGTSLPTESGTWTQLTIPNIPPGNDWTFIDSGDIDLSAYLGNSSVYIAFKYLSSDSAASTWEIGEVKIRE
ncbi:MAG: DUF5017 domain-containing protein [Chlorobi bacterium]|nr:DUF5017 domain-containing protein [Chlorobiota bacterium]